MLPTLCSFTLSSSSLFCRRSSSFLQRLSFSSLRRNKHRQQAKQEEDIALDEPAGQLDVLSEHQIQTVMVSDRNLLHHLPFSMWCCSRNKHRS